MKNLLESQEKSCQGRQSFSWITGTGPPTGPAVEGDEQQGVVGHSEMFASSRRQSCGNRARRDLKGRLAQGRFRIDRVGPSQKRISVGSRPSSGNSRGPLQDTCVLCLVQRACGCSQRRLSHGRGGHSGQICLSKRDICDPCELCFAQTSYRPDVPCLPSLQPTLPPAWTDRLY